MQTHNIWFILYKQFHTIHYASAISTCTRTHTPYTVNKQAQITTKQHTCMHVHTQIQLPFIQTICHLPTLPPPISWPKKTPTSPCSVADSDCIKASNSLNMRKFSWGYWISPFSLCNVMSLIYRVQCWMNQPLHKQMTGQQVSFEAEFSLL